jgi:hypothetical protein
MRYVIVLTFLLLLPPALLPAQRTARRKAHATPSPSPTPQSDPPKPSVAVSFERQSIRENDAVQVHAWLSNEWDYRLTDVTLRAEMPERLRWNNVPCADWPPQKFEGGVGDKPLDLGPLNAHEVKAYTFCIRSGPEISVGDFNIPFTFEYEWPRGDAARRSFVTSEKTLKANLFGSDSVAGVPLGLAGLVVPGLFAWFVFALFDVGWKPWPDAGLALGEKLFYSVLVSIPLLFVINWTIVGSFSFPDVNSGISLSKLLIYIGFGAALGAAVGGPIRLVKEIGRRLAERRQRMEEERARAEERRRQEERARQVQLNDAPDVLLEKLLRLYPYSRQPRAVVYLKNGTQFSGTLAQQGEDATALIASFQVKLDGLARQIVEELKQAQYPIDIFKIVRREQLEDRLETNAVIQENGVGVLRDEPYRTWNSVDVLRADVDQEGGDNAPLRLP